MWYIWGNQVLLAFLKAGIMNPQPNIRPNSRNPAEEVEEGLQCRTGGQGHHRKTPLKQLTMFTGAHRV